MGGSFPDKWLRFLSIVVPLMLSPVFFAGVRSTETVTGILGSNVTLKFTFNKPYDHGRHGIGLYYGNHTKKAECMSSSSPGAFFVNASGATVLYHMTNLSRVDSQVYFASLYTGDGPPPESNRVRLLVREDSETTTVSPDPSPSPVTEDSEESPSPSSALLLGTVLGPVLLLAAALPALSWCLLRNKESEGFSQESPIPTVAEQVSTSASSCPCERAPSSVVYSFLDFPKRAPRIVRNMSNDPLYATITHLPLETHV